jgi:hypothetical protein
LMATARPNLLSVARYTSPNPAGADPFGDLIGSDAVAWRQRHRGSNSV